MRLTHLYILFLIVLTPYDLSFAQKVDLGSSLIQDFNGNRNLEVLAFGGSVVSDAQTQSIPSGEAGYPLRLENFLGIGISNLGALGEQVSSGAVRRFATILARELPDLVLLSGGSNDAFRPASTKQIFHSVQAMIARGAEPILLTAPPTCCNRASLNPIINQYNSVFKRLALINDLALINTNPAFLNLCPVLSSCWLLNRPEGLHPHRAGYDVMGEVVAATLIEVDIFSENGPHVLESALGLPEGSSITVP